MSLIHEEFVCTTQHSMLVRQPTYEQPVICLVFIGRYQRARAATGGPKFFTLSWPIKTKYCMVKQTFIYLSVQPSLCMKKKAVWMSLELATNFRICTHCIVRVPADVSVRTTIQRIVELCRYSIGRHVILMTNDRIYSRCLKVALLAHKNAISRKSVRYTETSCFTASWSRKSKHKRAKWRMNFSLAVE